MFKKKVAASIATVALLSISLSTISSAEAVAPVMQTMGQAVVEIGKQTERQNRIETQVYEHSERMDGQDGRMTDLERKLEEMQQQLAAAQAEAASAKQEAAVAKEQANKRRGLFGWLR